MLSSIFLTAGIGFSEVITMGKRVRGAWYLPSVQGSILLLLSFLFLLGGVAGCLFVSLSQESGAAELRRYLADYMELAGQKTIAREFLPLLWGQIRRLLLVVLLGMTAVGVVGIPLLFCTRGFLFAFSVGCFCRVFGGAGAIPALILFGLPALLWGPAFFLVGLQGMDSARCLLLRGAGGDRNLIPFSHGYWFRVGLCCAMCLLCAWIEFCVVPVLLGTAAHIVL